MKMTRQQVADLLLNANEHFSNVEEYIYVGDKKQWRDNRTWNIESILYNISKNDSIYRIKDNSVKEVTPALRGKWARHKSRNYEMLIMYLDYTKQHIGIDNDILDLERFNTEWQLVED